MKCDEAKPACKRCTSTGRHCDGYESPFRTTVFAGRAVSKPTPTLTTTEVDDVAELSRCFSTKTIHDGVDLHNCNAEASQILAASRHDATLQHAILSLRALRGQYERGFRLGMAVQDYQDDELGIVQYNKALRGVASRLSSGSLETETAASAVRCCLLFVSIEQARQDYRAMATHMLRGLAIMSEHRARPTIIERDGEKVLRPAATGPEVPKLDLFLIKLFSAHCKFAEASSKTTAALCSPASSGDDNRDGDGNGDGAGAVVARVAPRQIVPDTRAELIRLAERIAQFLGQVSHVTYIQAARRLLEIKETLLDDLHKWASQPGTRSGTSATSSHEPLTPMFSDLFRLLLEIVVLPVLDLRPADRLRLTAARVEFGDLAGRIMEKVQDYRDPGSRSARAAR